MNYTTVRASIMALEQPERAVLVSRFFKTHPGQYGEGDVFLGLSMPQQRGLARQFGNLPIAETEWLVRDTYHDCRMTGLLIWTLQAKKAGSLLRQELAEQKGYLVTNTT